MILFNSIFLHQFGQQFNERFQLYNWKLGRKYRNFNNRSIAECHVCVQNLKIISSTLNFSNFRSHNPSFFEEYKNNKFIKRSFWQKLINEYVKETVFLSHSNTLSNDYVNKLKSLNLSIYKGSKYKNFVNKFNSDLLKGKINVELNSLTTSTFALPAQENHLYLKYTWPKLLSVRYNPVLKHKDTINNDYKSNIFKLFNSALPLFIIVNDQNEVILSESSDQIPKSGFLSSLYNRFIISNQSHKSVYTGLLFVNYDDALEYKRYINFSSLNATRKVNLKIVPTNISLYYKLMMLKSNRIDFRLIPDLREVSNLIYNYKKYKNVKFNINQSYGRNFFQGQPLYFIQSSLINEKFSKDFINLNNLHFYKPDNPNFKYQPVFLNYHTLISSWEKFRKENTSYNVPAKPIVYIYNLESFIKNYDNQENNSSIIFLPSYETYNTIKNSFNENFRCQKDLKFSIINKGLRLKTLCMRVFWSLTSRQPVKW